MSRLLRAVVVGAPPPCEVCGAAATVRKNGRWFCSRACRRTASFDRQLQKEYGLTEAAYRSLLQVQSARCPICLNPLLEQATRPYIDHDHITCRVRGLLCLTCNLLLGRLGDDPDRFERRAKESGEVLYARAAQYLRAPPAEALGQAFFAPRVRFLVRRMDPELAAILDRFP
ncbi:MAG TPA: endonuclease domain-containing protein [Candidatus Limnocylindria bacterium]